MAVRLQALHEIFMCSSSLRFFYELSNLFLDFLECLFAQGGFVVVVILFILNLIS